MNPKPIPYVDHPLFHERATFIELLQAPLPALPPLLQIELFESATAARPRRAETLSREESERAFLLYNANRRRVATSAPSTGRAHYAARARHMEEYLVRVNTPLVPFAFHMRCRKRAQYIDPDAAFSSGLEALLRAVRRFDVSRGWLFSTLAVRFILNEWLSVAAKSLRRRLPTCSMVGAEGRNIDVEAPEPVDNDLTAERAAFYEALRTNAAGLTAQEEAAIRIRFLGPTKVALEVVGNQLGGICKERTRQITEKALAKLRAVLVVET